MGVERPPILIMYFYLFAFLTAFLSTNALSSERNLTLDLAEHKEPGYYDSQFQQFINHTNTELHIYYSFGETNFYHTQESGTHKIRLSVSGELDESQANTEYVCEIEAIKNINWFFEELQMRKQPPFAEIQMNHCQKI